LLNEPRRPWLDADTLKEKFLALSSQSHPDRAHSLSDIEKEQAHARSTELNAAYSCLREPRDRLRHLLELEMGSLPKQIQEIPGDAMNLFMEVGQLCRQADAFLAEKNRATSPLLKVQAFERGEVWAEKLRALQDRITARRNTFLEELKQIDSIWSNDHRGELIPRVEKIYQQLSYLDRWLAQIQERITQLSF
jgi:DnaJ-domain-containing protein 1